MRDSPPSSLTIKTFSANLTPWCSVPPFVIIGTKIDEEGAEERFRLLKEKYSSETVLPLSIYMDELLEDVKKAFMKLADLDETKKDDDGGFTSRMDKDAVYRDEE